MPGKPCLDCQRDEPLRREEWQERYRATSYCLKHNSRRAQEAQKSSVLKKIISAKNWDRLQEKKTDGTFRFDVLQLLPLLKHYREMALAAAEAALTVEDRMSEDFDDVARQACDYLEIAKCLQKRRALTGQEKWDLADELGLGLPSVDEPVGTFAGAVELDVEPASSGRGNEPELLDLETGKPAVQQKMRASDLRPR
jgi:hypothetical protein